MENKNVCDECRKELDASGAVVFTPEGDAQQKRLCTSCFESQGTKEKK